MKLIIGILMLSAGLCSWVLADEPQTPAAQPAAAPTPASTSDAAKPAAAATIAAKADTSEKVDAAATEALVKKMRGRGYKPINRLGILVFCRKEGQLGTHFERERCSTIDELKDAELTGREYTKQIQQQASPTPFNPAGSLP